MESLDKLTALLDAIIKNYPEISKIEITWETLINTFGDGYTKPYPKINIEFK